MPGPAGIRGDAGCLGLGGLYAGDAATTCLLRQAGRTWHARHIVAPVVRCAEWLQRTPDVLMVPATVLAETCYLIDRTLGPTAEAAFLDSVGMGPDCTFQLVDLVDSDLRRMSGLVRQYADLRLGGTDASVVAICERLGIITVATVNLRDFAAVRPRHVPAFITVPGFD